MTPFAVTCVKYEPDTRKTFGLVTTPEFRQIVWVSGQVDAIQFTDLVKPWVERKLGEFWTMIPLIEGNPRRGGGTKGNDDFPTHRGGC